MVAMLIGLCNAPDVAGATVAGDADPIDSAIGSVRRR
jgi:hypothetical protein